MSGACSATYRVDSWPDGFQGEVTVRAGNAAISGWTVNWAWPGSQTIPQLWGRVRTAAPTSP
ncbi:cellulose binding domain-containing protein [Microbispora bryophytorum]|uniref:cellulose binding domain-containing protein n=1 Tax=Microbispora bryophytorum TaxID=1460882 RepID=UPI0033E7EC68